MFEAYKIAVRISVIDGVTPALAAISKSLSGAQKNVTGLQSALESTNRLFKLGAASAGAGFLGLTFFDKAIDKAKEYQNQLSLLSTTGASQMEIAQGVSLAWKTSHEVMTTSAADNLKAVRELRAVLGQNSMGEIDAVLPIIQRVTGAVAALTGKVPEGVANDIVRFTELRGSGLVTEAALKRNAELMGRTVLAMGGTVTPSDMQAALKQSKLAGMNLNDEFVFQELPFLIQEWKSGHAGSGQAAGTALMSTFQTLIGGVIKKSAVPLWEQAGLINPSDVVKNKGGGYQLKPGAMKDAALYQANPYAWVQQDLAPAVTHLAQEQHLTREQVLMGMVGNRNSVIQLATMMAKAPQIERDRTLIQQAPDSLTAYNRLVKTNPELAQMALTKQWENVQTQLAFRTLPQLIRITNLATRGLDRLTGVMSRHPVLTKRLAEGFVLLSGAMAIGGTLATLRAGFGGITMLGTPAVKLAAVTADLGMRFMGAAGRGLTLAGNLGTMVNMMGKLPGAMGAVSMATGALAAALGGYVVGTLIYDKMLAGTKAADSIGKFGASIADLFGNHDAQDAQDAATRAHFNAIQMARQAHQRMLEAGISKLMTTPNAGIAAMVDPTSKLPDFGATRSIAAQAFDSSTGASPYVASARTQPAPITVPVYLDGQKIAQVVSKYQVEAGTGPQTGMSSYDSSMFPSPIGMNSVGAF